jgi:hypothetical protein
MIFILGIVDLFIAGVFALKLIFNFAFLDNIILSGGIYLLIKGAIFLMSLDFASVLDVLSGIVLISAYFFEIPFVIGIIVIVFLVQKGIFSLVSSEN